MQLAMAYPRGRSRRVLPSHAALPRLHRRGALARAVARRPDLRAVDIRAISILARPAPPSGRTKSA